MKNIFGFILIFVTLFACKHEDTTVKDSTTKKKKNWQSNEY
jgi:hypothetical protein